jgi:homogentisate 1,2-dioxygenase
MHEVVYATHPFDVIGWDGYNFPYGFSIHNFEPITGRVHQPPPVHQTFETATLWFVLLYLDCTITTQNQFRTL